MVEFIKNFALLVATELRTFWISFVLFGEFHSSLTPMGCGNASVNERKLAFFSLQVL